MALPILDGNQSATTLSTILSSGQHIPAHTVVSLGTQAITDMRGAVSGSVVSISNFPATQPVSIASVTIGNTVTIAGTVTANPTGTQTIAGTVTIGAGTSQIGSVTASISNSVTIASLPAISGTVTANGGNFAYAQDEDTDNEGDKGVLIGWRDYDTGEFRNVSDAHPLPISGTVTANLRTDLYDLPNDQYVNRSALHIYEGDWNYPVGSANPLPISGTVTANTFALQGTAVTTSNFTSTTASTLLAGYNATREVLTIFNEGAGNLHICAGATCTTIAYQVRLSAGDYYEVPNHQTTITHSAIFATAGTARVTEVS